MTFDLDFQSKASYVHDPYTHKVSSWKVSRF